MPEQRTAQARRAYGMRMTKTELLNLVREMRDAMRNGNTCKCPTTPNGAHEPTCAWLHHQYMLNIAGGVLDER